MAEETNKTPFKNDEILNKKINPIVKPEKEIGIDTKDAFYQNIVNAGKASALDTTAISAFTQISNSRDQVYTLLDTMAEDSSIAAILETYAEDATEYNDQGRIVWVDSSNSAIGTYVDFLLKSLKVDKNIYKWMYSLCKYGDLYLRLYHQSEYNDLIFEPTPEPTTLNETFDNALLREDLKNSKCQNISTEKDLTEDVLIKAYAKNDRYVRYLEMVPNPAEMFELTRFGKTAGYIQAPASIVQNMQSSESLATNNYFRYNFKKKDIKIYSAKEFVHACLEDNTSRVPEEVQIFLPKADLIKKNPKYTYDSEYSNDASSSSDYDSDSDVSTSYSVRRGQSLLYNSYKIWRMLQLLENAILLSRLTRSSLVRVIQVEVGDMPKESVVPHMMNIKSLMEQKSAFSVDTAMSEYTNPGAVENCVYIPTHGGVGNITMTPIGGDYNIRDIADLDYYQDKFYGSMRVPKQFFGVTKDGAGFDGGKSLSIISSRYAKMIKRIQNTMVQTITDAINLILLNEGLENYINKFTIKMLPPTTQEEIDRRENSKNRLDFIDSIMNLLSDVSEVPVKLKILKTLLASVITDTEVVELIQDEIERLERENAKQDDEVENAAGGESEESEKENTPPEPHEPPSFSDVDTSTPMNFNSEPEPGPSNAAEPGGESDNLPSGADLGVDLTDFA